MFTDQFLLPTYFLQQLKLYASMHVRTYIYIHTYTYMHAYMLGMKQYYNTVWRETLAGGNIGKFGESSVICQTKTIQISSYN